MQAKNHSINSQEQQNQHIKNSLKSKSLTNVKQLLSDISHSLKKRPASLKKKQISLDREQIRKQMKSKWKDPGYCNIQFSTYKALKAKFLNQWEIQRIYLAARSYKAPKYYKGFKQCIQSRQFPKVRIDAYSQKFQNYLSTTQEQRENQMFKTNKLKTETAASSRNKVLQKKPKRQFQAFTTQNKAFGMGNVVWKKGDFLQKIKTQDF